MVILLDYRAGVKIRKRGPSWDILEEEPNPIIIYILDIQFSSVDQSCPTLCNPMDCSSSGSSVPGILQARVLEWVAYPFYRGSSWPRNWTRVSWIVGRFFTSWATREALCTWILCYSTSFILDVQAASALRSWRILVLPILKLPGPPPPQALGKWFLLGPVMELAGL